MGQSKIRKGEIAAEQESQENEISWLFLSKNADQLPGIGYPPVKCVDFFIFLGYSKIMLL